MKINMPVTDNEVFINDGNPTVSKTDLKGRITYVNKNFLEVSGYSEEELIGKSHNIVRHPDMPPEAFDDLWATIKGGKPWTGLVKNRCKNGDFYWVKANVTPIYNNGQLIEYISVRHKPERSEIEAAEAFYKQIKDNRHLIHEGRSVGGMDRVKRVVFGKLKLGHKLASIAMGVIVLAAIVMNMNMDRFEVVEHLEDELAGIAYIAKVKTILEHMPKHRGLSQVLLKGDNSVSGKVAKQKQGVDEAFSSLVKMSSGLPDKVAQKQTLEALQKEWKQLASRNSILKPKESFEQHTILIEQVLNWIVKISIDSRLTTDQRADTSFLISIATRDIPAVTEKMGQARGLGAGLLAKGEMSEKQAIKLRSLQTYIQVSFDNINQSMMEVYRANPELKEGMSKLSFGARSATQSFLEDIQLLSNEDFTFKKAGQYFGAGTDAISSNFALFERSVEVISADLNERLSDAKHSIYLSLVINSFIILLVLITIFTVGRSLFLTIRQATHNAKSMSEGNYYNEFNITGSDELSQMLFALKAMQVRQGFEVQETKRKAEESTRIKNALDVCNTNVMLADNDMNIIYLNDSVQAMFDAANEDLKAEIDGFDSAQLEGSNADIFHKNPEHQRQMIKYLKEAYKSEIKVAGRTFALVATPVIDEEGQRLGTVIEWNDRTEELVRLEEERRVSNENARMKQALDSVSANVMVADADLNIIYMNEAVEKTLRHAEQAIRTELKHFSVDNVIGNNIDIFHKNPSHQRHILVELKDEVKASIEVGGRHMDLVVNPIVNDEGERIGTVVEWDDQTENLLRLKEERRVSNENARMKQALDTVSANVMVADADRNIIYMNQAVTDTLSHAESDLRKELSNFSVNNLIGNSIDMFHKNPAHQARMLDVLTGEHRASILVGGRHMDLVVNPINNDQNERIGTVVEWADRTNEVAIEKEVDELVFAAANGDLSKRLDPVGKEGFFAKLTEGLNQTVGAADSFLKDMGQVLSALAEGDLTKNIVNDYRGSFGDLKSDVNTTVAKLTEVMAQIRESTTMVHEASTEISQGNADLSARTESQASSLEETAASMEQITSTVKESAENAQLANGKTKSAREQAVSGGDIVHNAVDAMKEILTSSHKINDIIGVIDEIAFQTNLLALNAAVEAARAGEHGKGFAVVAGEVRTLSQRSASAAKEIKDLIRESVNKVESGSSMVNQSGETLTEIVRSVEDVANMVEEIASAAQEQNDGIGQINQAVMQMDDMTQQNAALVEQASASSEALKEQASALSRMVSFFRVDEKSMRIATSSNSPVHTPSNETVVQQSVSPAESQQIVDTSNAPSEDQVIKYSSNSSQSDDDWEDF